MKQAERPQHRKAPHLRTHGGAGTRAAGVPLRTRRLSTDSAKGAPWLCGRIPGGPAARDRLPEREGSVGRTSGNEAGTRSDTAGRAGDPAPQRRSRLYPRVSRIF